MSQHLRLIGPVAGEDPSAHMAGLAPWGGLGEQYPWETTEPDAQAECRTGLNLSAFRIPALHCGPRPKACGI